MDAERTTGRQIRPRRNAGASRAAWFTSASRGSIIFACAVFAILLGGAAILLSYKVQPPPDNARVLTDDQRFTYASTPCVIYNRLERELILNRDEISDASKALRLFTYSSERTIKDVEADSRWRRDAVCNYAAGFDQIVTRWMKLVGYRSRWSDDGQWRW